MFTTTIIQLALLFNVPNNPNSPSLAAPDACSVVHRITGYPTICEPHPVGAPVYDKTICCAGAACFPSVDGCHEGERSYDCELGEVDAKGRARCYFEVPDYCDVYDCKQNEGKGVGGGGWEMYLCCIYGACELAPGWAECTGDVLWCSNGVSNEDGTVTCLDE